MWVLAACAGRSTRSKGSQQTLRLSHPVRVARKQGKERLRAFHGQETGQGRLAAELLERTWRGRPLGQAQEAPAPWNLPAWGPGSYFTAFRKIGGIAPSDGPRPPKLPKTDQAACRENWHRPRRSRVPGICQAGAPDPPGGTPPHPQNRPKTPSWSWVWGSSLLLDGKKSIAGLGHCSPRIPGGFTLPHRSDPRPRSEPRAPMQMVSGALGSFGAFLSWLQLSAEYRTRESFTCCFPTPTFLPFRRLGAETRSPKPKTRRGLNLAAPILNPT